VDHAQHNHAGAEGTRLREYEWQSEQHRFEALRPAIERRIYFSKESPSSLLLGILALDRHLPPIPPDNKDAHLESCTRRAIHQVWEPSLAR